MSLEVVLIGHIVIDTIVRGTRRWQNLGGTVVYGAFAALRHEAKPSIVSKVGEDFPDEYFLFLSRNGIDLSHVRVVRGMRTTRFKLTYKDSERELTLQSRAEDITAYDVELINLDGKIVVAGPVIGELAPSILESIHSRAALTAVDLQGYLRTAKVKGEVKLSRSEAAVKALENADIVHADAEEASVLTSLEPPSAAAWIASRGPKAALVTMGSAGAYVATTDKVLYVPSFEPSQVVDTTGAGDIFLTVFTVEYARGAPLEEAAAMAAAAVSFRVERQGFDSLRERWVVRGRAQRILDSIQTVNVQSKS